MKPSRQPSAPAFSQWDIDKLCYAAGEHRDIDYVRKQVAAYGAEIINRTHTGNVGTPLMYAANYGNTQIIAFLLENGADINLRADGGWTALMASAWWTSTPDATQLLLEKGADPEVRDSEGRTALMRAREKNLEDIAHVLEDWEARKARAAQALADEIAGFSPALKRRIAAPKPFRP